jgi:phosphoglycerate dehydrogenase-like enzyme
MHVFGFRRDPNIGAGAADSVHTPAHLPTYLPQADIIAPTCTLTDETGGVAGAQAFGLLWPSAHPINVARGGCVEEPAPIHTLQTGRLAGAELDCADPELPARGSVLWSMPNVFPTPHTGDETTRYEANIIEILLENLQRLWVGEVTLRNRGI